jgi:hypothetical protein
MRRGLSPADLGDLFEQPIAAVISISRPDGTVFSRPVWHRFVEGRFRFEIPAGDRKIAMLERGIHERRCSSPRTPSRTARSRFGAGCG